MLNNVLELLDSTIQDHIRVYNTLPAKLRIGRYFLYILMQDYNYCSTIAGGRITEKIVGTIYGIPIEESSNPYHFELIRNTVQTRPYTGKTIKLDFSGEQE